MICRTALDERCLIESTAAKAFSHIQTFIKKGVPIGILTLQLVSPRIEQQNPPIIIHFRGPTHQRISYILWSTVTGRAKIIFQRATATDRRTEPRITTARNDNPSLIGPAKSVYSGQGRPGTSARNQQLLVRTRPSTGYSFPEVFLMNDPHCGTRVLSVGIAPARAFYDVQHLQQAKTGGPFRSSRATMPNGCLFCSTTHSLSRRSSRCC